MRLKRGGLGVGQLAGVTGERFTRCAHVRLWFDSRNREKRPHRAPEVSPKNRKSKSTVVHHRSFGYWPACATRARRIPYAHLGPGNHAWQDAGEDGAALIGNGGCGRCRRLKRWRRRARRGYTNCVVGTGLLHLRAQPAEGGTADRVCTMAANFRETTTRFWSCRASGVTRRARLRASPSTNCSRSWTECAMRVLTRILARSGKRAGRAVEMKKLWDCREPVASLTEPSRI